MAIDRTAYNAIVDSNGTPGHGTPWDKSLIATSLLDPIDDAIVAGAGAVVVQTTTITGTNSDFAATPARHLLLRLNNASLLTLTGFAAGSAGDIIELISVGAGQFDLANQHSGSAAANRAINGVTGTISLAAGSGRATLIYDGTTARWRVLSHEQGAWITPTFAAGDFTGSGSMTWTVEAGDVTTYAYRLSGRTLMVSVSIVTTTVGGTLSSDLTIAIPGGFTAAKDMRLPILVQDNATDVLGYAYVNGTAIKCRRFDDGNMSAATNASQVHGELYIEVALGGQWSE